MKITDEMVERAAHAMCVEGGFDPNERMPNDGPRWKYYAPNARSALTAALAEQTQQGVEVKALEWRAEPPYHVARVFGNVYAVEAWDGGVTLFGIGGRRDFKTVSEAKTAAQADYETRIRSALVDVPAVESEPAAKPDWWQDEEAAEREFTEYFVRNYPGPDTIIHDPKWHAPKLFRAAKRALLATALSTRKGSAGDGSATGTSGGDHG